MKKSVHFENMSRKDVFIFLYAHILCMTNIDMALLNGIDVKLIVENIIKKITPPIAEKEMLLVIERIKNCVAPPIIPV